jgi:hypothetical protein
MLTHDLKGLIAFVDITLSLHGKMDEASLRIVLRKLNDIHAQAHHLEQAQVPRRQRMTDDHLRGNVTMLPIIPRDQAVRP